MRQIILALTATLVATQFATACTAADKAPAAAKQRADSLAAINAKIPRLTLHTVPSDSIKQLSTCVRDSIPLGVLVECTLPGGSSYTLHQDTIVGIQDGPKLVALDASPLEQQWHNAIGQPYAEQMGAPTYLSLASDSSSLEAIWDGMDMSRTFVNLARTPEGGVIRRVVGDCHPKATHRPVKGCDR